MDLQESDTTERLSTQSTHKTDLNSNSGSFFLRTRKGFPGGSDSKESACNTGDLGAIPGLGRSPGVGNGNPLQYSCLENSKDRGVWWATVREAAKIQMQLSMHTSIYGAKTKPGRVVFFLIDINIIIYHVSLMSM